MLFRSTFKNARNVLEVISFLPMDRILLETDSPYLAPVPHRGENNKPEYIRYVAEVIARLKDLTVDEVLQITENNARRLFNI